MSHMATPMTTMTTIREMRDMGRAPFHGGKGKGGLRSAETNRMEPPGWSCGEEMRRRDSSGLLVLDLHGCSPYMIPMAMKKRMISFTDPQEAFLKREAKKLGISVSDLVRRIVDQYREGK